MDNASKSQTQLHIMSRSYIIVNCSNLSCTKTATVRLLCEAAVEVLCAQLLYMP